MKKIWMLILGVAFVASMAGCGAQSMQKGDSSSNDNPTSLEEPATEDFSESQSVEITAVELTEQQASAYEANGIVLLSGEECTYSSYFLVSFDQAVTELFLWRIEMNMNSDGAFVGNETECIGSVQSLMPDEQVILAGGIGELLPTLGISFVTDDGVKVHAYLTISGKDGSPLIVEYDIANAE